MATLPFSLVGDVNNPQFIFNCCVLLIDVLISAAFGSFHLKVVYPKDNHSPMLNTHLNPDLDAKLYSNI